MRTEALWQPAQRPSQQTSQSRHPSCQKRIDEHHYLPDRLSRSGNAVARDERPGTTMMVTTRAPLLLKGRLYQHGTEIRGRLRWNDFDDTAAKAKTPQLITSRKPFFPGLAVDAPYRIGYRSPHHEPRACPPLLRAVSELCPIQ